MRSILLLSAPAAEENRCGWFINPTPGNAWLKDRDGEWTVGIQGGEQTEGGWPSFGRGRWVATNGSYGYGCACMRVTVGHAKRSQARFNSEDVLVAC